jgi:hypothetical protein
MILELCSMNAWLGGPLHTKWSNLVNDYNLYEVDP